WMSVTFSNNTVRDMAVALEQQLPALGMLGGGGFNPGPRPNFDKGGFNPPPFDKGGFNPPNLNDQRFLNPRTSGFAPGVGKVVLQQASQLNHKIDPPCKYRGGCGQKTYTCQMTAGKTYQMEVNAGWDNYLYFEDDGGKLLREDDDGAGYPNARIVFRC